MTAVAIPSSATPTPQLREIAGMAIDRIIESDTARVLTWTGQKIDSVSITAKRAAKFLAAPTCLGVYDFDSTVEQILEDLLTVIQDS